MNDLEFTHIISSHPDDDGGDDDSDLSRDKYNNK